MVGALLSNYGVGRHGQAVISPSLTMPLLTKGANYVG
jgi:hypothetical protein